MFDFRIKKNYWQLLKYSIDLSIAGVSLSKDAVYRKFTRYNFPTYLRNMSKTVATRAIRKNVGLKIGKILQKQIITLRIQNSIRFLLQLHK